MIAARANLWTNSRPAASTRRAIPCVRAAASRGLGVLD